MLVWTHELKTTESVAYCHAEYNTEGFFFCQ